MGKISSAFKKTSSDSAPSLRKPFDEKKTASTPIVEEVGSLLTQTSAQVTKETNSHTPSKWDEKLSLAIENTTISESMKMLRAKILHATSGENTRTILITSAEAQEGKSFITANLAISIAQDVKQHALMVNCDLRRPSLSSLLGFDNPPGLTEYLRDEQDISELLLHTGLPDLNLLPSGQPPSNPAELLTSDRMAFLIDELKTRYDDRLILFDSPPALAAAETTVLSQHVDKILLVVKWGSSSRENIKKCIEILGQEKILGIIFNAFDMTVLDKKTHGLGYQGYYAYTPSST